MGLESTDLADLDKVHNGDYVCVVDRFHFEEGCHWVCRNKEAWASWYRERIKHQLILPTICLYVIEDLLSCCNNYLYRIIRIVRYRRYSPTGKEGGVSSSRST